ncbi:amidase family protein [Limibaculum sp. M0105]|uniref:Amidase family protein n=1 Tax=Thermohalobaculum xanthum TaxID=2753746 RepID=A0A8J7M5Z6_9RHOB|nr:amidase family protein [Thermohalobaculum xanthum]MBK0399161.1 amidase family protein [Thermohalobaculum xanthum]
MSELWKHSAETLAALVRSRDVSAVEVTRSALDRLAAVNPALNAVVDELPSAALAEAARIDAALARGEETGPLAGVPVTVKVNVDMAGHATTNGLRLQRDLVAETDSPVVANLRRAGAVIVGRTNTPAFSLRWFTRNSLHGATLNPHDRDLTPGGSSGGAASAVAAGIGAVAHGTDIAGSIRYPAYACGVHGLRPGLGRVPAHNFTGPDRTIGAQLTAVSGPLARRIGDLRLAFRAMSAADPRDPWWMPGPASMPPVARRAALCIAPEGMPTEPAVADALRRAAAALAAAGWDVDECEPPSFRTAARINMSLWMEEFRVAGLPKLEPEGDPDARIVAAALRAVAAKGQDPQAELIARATLLREWQLFLEEWPVLICPVSAEPPFPDLLDVAGEAEFAQVYEAQLTQVGLPALGIPGLTVAAGTPGMPMGVQLVAGRCREELLLDAGAVIEAQMPPVEPVTPFARG